MRLVVTSVLGNWSKNGTLFPSPLVHSFLGDLRWVARFGLMSQIGASQTEAPIGSVFQKYVCSTFMVKMRIDLGS